MEIIHTYSRQKAIEDGVLVDITDTKEAKEAGFEIPVCLTAAVHALVEVPEGMEGFQDYAGRLWDTVYMATHAVKCKRLQGATEEEMEIIAFQVDYSMPAKTKAFKQVTYDLWLTFNKYEGFTIMLPSDY